MPAASSASDATSAHLSVAAIDSDEPPGIVAASFAGNTRRRYKELAAKSVAADVLARLLPQYSSTA